ncbi:hypothetical protein OQA88_6009 [Cercophora sp. LCS_1]
MGTGYRSYAVVTGLRSPRHLVVDKGGNLLVAEDGRGSVRRLVLQENGDATNHGVALSADGKTLFTSSLASVTAYPYDAATGQVGTGKVIVSGMSNTVVGRSMIKTFSINACTRAACDYTSGGEVLGWGLRNIVGVGGDPAYGGFRSVENSLDDMRMDDRDVHVDNPAKRFSYHGILNATTNARKGLNFGYPSCFGAWDPSTLGQSSLQVGQLVRPDGVPAASDCAQSATGRLHFHAHTAPLDIKFNANRTAAYISFHGSWNRNPADGYRVMRVDFKEDQPIADSTSNTAQIPVMENPNTRSCPRAASDRSA